MDITMWKEFGLPGLIMFSVVGLLFMVIKWTLATTRDIMAQSAKERECWVKALNEHTLQAKTFHEEVKDAHRYQREEHIKLTENQNIVTQSLKEVEKALGRINGYK